MKNDGWRYALEPEQENDDSKYQENRTLQNLSWSESKTVDEIAAWIVDNLAPSPKNGHYNTEPSLPRGCELDRAILRYYHKKMKMCRGSGFTIPLLDYHHISSGSDRKGKIKNTSDKHLAFGVVTFDHSGFLRPLEDDEVVFVSKHPILTFPTDFEEIDHILSLERTLDGRRKNMYWNEAYSESEFFDHANSILPRVLSEMVGGYVCDLYFLTFGEFKYGLDYAYGKLVSPDVIRAVFEMDEEITEEQCVADRIPHTIVDLIEPSGTELFINTER